METSSGPWSPMSAMPPAKFLMPLNKRGIFGMLSTPGSLPAVLFTELIALFTWSIIQFTPDFRIFLAELNAPLNALATDLLMPSNMRLIGSATFERNQAPAFCHTPTTACHAVFAPERIAPHTLDATLAMVLKIAR